MMPSPSASFYRESGNARKIIVVDFGFLGDTIHLVPALWEIHRHYPEAEVHVLTTPVGQGVLQLVPCVKQTWAVELDPQRRTLRQQWQILCALRRERFDLAFNFSGADRTIIWTALTGARHRVAQATARAHFWNAWLIPNWAPRQPASRPVFEQRRQVLAACGLELAPPRWDFTLPEAAKRKAESLGPDGAIHLSVSASHPLKEWPLENWIALAQRWLAVNPAGRLLATGSPHPREQARLESLARAIGDERLTKVSDLSIAELAAALQRCRLHVGADSGVLHLAMAVGLPTVSLFRDYNDASAWTPAGTRHRVFRLPCVCVNQRHQPCAIANRAECLAKLEVEQVVTAIGEQLTNSFG